VTHQGDFALEPRMALFEQLINAVALLQNDSSDVSFICRTLVEQDIQPQVSNQVADSGDTFNRDVVKAWIFLIGSIKITYTLLKI